MAEKQTSSLGSHKHKRKQFDKEKGITHFLANLQDRWNEKVDGPQTITVQGIIGASLSSIYLKYPCHKLNRILLRRGLKAFLRGCLVCRETLLHLRSMSMGVSSLALCNTHCVEYFGHQLLAFETFVFGYACNLSDSLRLGLTLKLHLAAKIMPSFDLFVVTSTSLQPSPQTPWSCLKSWMLKSRDAFACRTSSSHSAR